MKILSWDIGIINLSYCIIEYNENDKSQFKICEWGIINLMETPEMKKNRNLLFENIPKKLSEYPFLLDVDKVVLENQPSLKNPQMKSIQMIVYSYFICYGKILNPNEKKIQFVDFCNASNKLKVYKGPEISIESLKKRKKKPSDNDQDIPQIPISENNDDNIQIENKKKTKKKLSYTEKKKMAVEHVKYFIKDEYPEQLIYFNEHKKKDDLADSFLQGLYCINYQK
jgi:hypothetical protein